MKPGYVKRRSLFLLMGCAAISLLLSGCGKGKATLSITSTPAGAHVIVNGAAQGETPTVLENLEPGQYVVKLQKDGYDTVYKAVALLEKQRLSLAIPMKKSTGLLLVDSKPENVDVVINGVSKGNTPLLLTDLPFGTYKLEFKSPKVLPRTMEADLTDRKPVRVFADLVSNTAKLVIGSDPTGAVVRVNGVVRGSAPLTLDDVAAGKTDLKVSLPGYSTYARQMDLRASQTYQIVAQLEALPSGLTVLSTPQGATVSVDGQAMGKTPFTTSLKDGAHDLEVALMGYETQSTNLVLKPDVNKRLEYTLVKNSGTLVLDTEPASVKVYVDGSLFATTVPKSEADTLSQSMSILLKAGESHEIQLVRDGYVSSSFTVQPKLDQVITRHEILKRIFVRDTKITTKTEVIKCRLEYKLPNGNIYYERFPGVYDTAKASDIIKVEPIGLDDASNREARRLIEQNRKAVPKQ